MVAHTLTSRWIPCGRKCSRLSTGQLNKQNNNNTITAVNKLLFKFEGILPYSPETVVVIVIAIEEFQSNSNSNSNTLDIIDHMSGPLPLRWWLFPGKLETTLGIPPHRKQVKI